MQRVDNTPSLALVSYIDTDNLQGGRTVFQVETSWYGARSPVQALNSECASLFDAWRW